MWLHDGREGATGTEVTNGAHCGICCMCGWKGVRTKRLDVLSRGRAWAQEGLDALPSPPCKGKPSHS